MKSSLFILVSILLCLSISEPLSAQVDVSDALSDVDKYFSENGADIDFESYLIYNFLERKFAVEKIDFQGDKEYNVSSPFQRLIKKGIYIEKTDIDSINSRIDRFTLPALYCDIYGLEGDWFELLNEYSELSGYYLTHCLIAIQWTKENGCYEAHADALKEKEQQLVKSLAFYLNKQSSSYDKFVEALAFLMYSGRKDVIKPDWINLMISYQRSDGGWAKNHKTTESNFHTSVLAYWALLEWHGQTKSNENWIR